MWSNVKLNQQWERMLGFTLPVGDRVIVIAYDGLDLIQLHEPGNPTWDDRYAEGKGIYDWQKQILDYEGVRYRVLGLHGGEPLLISKYGETLSVDTVTQTLTIRDASGIVTLTHHYLDASGDWLAMTFSPDAQYVLLGFPYGLDVFRRM